MSASGSEHDRLPEINTVLSSSKKQLYKLIKVIGEGGFGCVFLAYSEKDKREYALKAEKYSKSLLKIEIGVLKRANSRSCEHICELIDHGRVRDEFMFIVTTLLGPDLHELKNRQPGKQFTTNSVVNIAIQTLSAIEELHACGYISRDIKPGNFAIGDKEKDMHRRIYILDFGLAKRYLDKQSVVIPPREKAGWRGTTRYGPLNAHRNKDLSRRDDLESWLYMIVEFTKGALPWRNIEDRAVVQSEKEAVRDDGMEKFFDKCPKQFASLLQIIDCLKFEQEPPYEKIYDILNDIIPDKKGAYGDSCDWLIEKPEDSNLRQSSAEPRQSKPQHECSTGRNLTFVSCRRSS